MCECLGGKPERAMKVKNAWRLRWEPVRGHHRPIMISGERFESEHRRWDPKDGEIYVVYVGTKCHWVGSSFKDKSNYSR